MQYDRRTFIAVASRLLATTVAWLGASTGAWRAGAAKAQPSWSVRRATVNDLAALRDIFNAQRAAGLFPFADKIEPWTVQKAADLLGVYTGTRVLTLGGNAVGFVAFVDYTDAATTSAIAADADPEVAILAVRVDQLTQEQRVAASKRLAAAVCRDLLRQGFRGCEALIHARTGFQDLFADHMDVKSVNERDGVAEAKTVRFGIADIVTDLEAEGI